MPQNIQNLITEMRNNKYIIEKQFGDISSFNFSRKAFFNKIWDEQTMKARGLFINTKTNEIVLRSYEKFFNINERPETSIDYLKEHFPEEINEKLSDEIDVICKTLDFSSKIVKRRKNAEIIIEPIFVGQNKVIDAIIQTIDRDEGKKLKNSIVSIRSYLDRVIGESLN